MVHNNEDAMNKVPLNSSNGLDDEEKNGGEFMHDTSVAEEARREQMRANILAWMKKLTIVLICFIGIALISYVVISLCFSEWPKSTNHSKTTATTTIPSIITTTPRTNTSTTNPSFLSDNDSSNNNVTPATAAVSRQINNTYATSDNGVAVNATADTANTAAFTETDTATTATTSTLNSTMPNVEPLTATPLKDEPITMEKFSSTLDVYEKAAVCSDKQVCSRIGSNILKIGGSAVDSAIATLLCNGIVTMQSLGIGGGMLMNIYEKNSRKAHSIDARERAPFGSNQNMFDENINASRAGGLSVAVPGELMGYYRAHDRFGKLPWKQLVEPSLTLCNEGFYISKHQHNALKSKWKQISNNTIIIETFVNSTTGQLHSIGTKVKPAKSLCETYKTLAEKGPLDFYNGSLAKLVAADLLDYGSLVTADDLESYTADLVSSISMQLGNDILYAVPPISSGAVVANILSVLEGYNFSKANLKDAKSEAIMLHRLAEALKFAFAKRWELGDLRFNDVRELVSKLTNPEFSNDIRSQINDSTTHDDVYEYGAQFMGVDDVGTSHIVVLAPNGDAVSVTSSINEYFGSTIIGARTGIIFNNAMNDFSIPGHSNFFGLPSAPSNFIEERKRPMSSMSPMILADQAGNVKLLLGSAGGPHIISAVVEVMARVLWLNQNIKEAIDAPRIHHQLLPNELQYEDGALSEELMKLLQAKGHKLKALNGFGSVVCGIMRNNTAIYANADYRKHGGTAGY